jgi:hypothetical protein
LGRNNSEQVFSAKSQEQRTLHKAFLRYHDPENWPMLRKALRRMNRADLIGNGDSFLVPGESRREKEIKKRETKKVKPLARSARSARSAPRRR